MRSLLLLLALTLATGACSLTGPGVDPRDPLDAMLVRAYEEVPGFGGVRFDRGDALDAPDWMTIYTLGVDPAAEAAIRERVSFGISDGEVLYDHGYDIHPRPAQGSGTPELAEQVRDALPPDALVTVALDASSGYVRISCRAADRASTVSHYLNREGVSQENLLIQVVGR